MLEDRGALTPPPPPPEEAAIDAATEGIPWRPCRGVSDAGEQKEQSRWISEVRM